MAVIIRKSFGFVNYRWLVYNSGNALIRFREEKKIFLYAKK